MTIIALPIDGPGTVKINDRYIWLFMRAVFLVMRFCLLLAKHVGAQLYLALVATMLLIVRVWAWNISLDEAGAFIEPRGLSLMMSRELKS